MRVWDISVKKLCNKHLLGQHREIHAIHTFITTEKGGSYKHHPEVRRWVGYLPHLWVAHFMTVNEMRKRGIAHKSNIEFPWFGGSILRPSKWQSVIEQKEILKNKGCKCRVR